MDSGATRRRTPAFPFQPSARPAPFTPSAESTRSAPMEPAGHWRRWGRTAAAVKAVVPASNASATPVARPTPVGHCRWHGAEAVVPDSAAPSATYLTRHRLLSGRGLVWPQIRGCAKERQAGTTWKSEQLRPLGAAVQTIVTALFEAETQPSPRLTGPKEFVLLRSDAVDGNRRRTDGASNR